MFCMYCGKSLPDGAAFCGQCGKAVPNLSVAPAAAPETAPQAEVLPQEPVPETPETPVEAPAETLVETPVEAPVEPPVEAPVETPKKQKKEKKGKTRKKKRHFVLRMFCQFFSFLLCLLLVVSLLATVALADLRQLTTGGGIKDVLNALLTAPASQVQVETAPLTAVPGLQANSLSDIDIGDIDVDISDIPEDILTGGDTEENINALLEWVYEMIEEEVGSEEIPFSAEELQEFLEESTAIEYVSDKLAGFAEDFLNGTENTNITTEEIMQLLEENEELLNTKLHIKLTPEIKEDIRLQVDNVVVEQDINNVIRDTVSETVDNALGSTVGVSTAQVQELLRTLVSDKVFYCVIAVCAAIALLLLACNFYNLPAGLSWSSFACALVGFVVSAPLMMTELLIQLAKQYLPEVGEILPIVVGPLQTLAPLHYGLMIGGAAVFVITMIWRIIFFFVNRKRPEAQ